ncbi:MAG: M24 family metallopeptidase, partial [Chloroflexota bacterium]
AVLERAGPGMACEDVDKIARDLISEAGYGDQFIHRVGHGLGLDTHEEPYMVGGNRTPLRPGMTFSDEPGIYLEGKFGVRIEDLLLVTEDGCVSLNHADRDIRIVH